MTSPEIIEILKDRGALCRAILASLPEWFGRPEANERYAAAADLLPMFACRAAGAIAGLVSVKRQTEAAMELHLLAVRRAFHRQGIGRALVERAARHARESGARYLTVKTLAPSHPDPGYAATRRFYAAAGFLPIEEFPTLWSPNAPCLLMLRPV